MRLKIGYILQVWPAVFAAAFVFCTGIASADSPSFDRRMAGDTIEKTICNSPKLSELDRQLDIAYRTAQSASGIDKAALLADQRDWLRERDAECAIDYVFAGGLAHTSDNAKSWHEICLQETYISRLGALRSPPHFNDALCQGISDRLPPTGSRIIMPSSILGFLETGPRPVFVGDGGEIDGFSLESKYEGSLYCQSNTLYQHRARGKSVFPLLADYQNGNGEFCGGDAIHLTSLNGTPVLVEDVEQFEGMESNGAKITVKVLQNGRWSHSCAIRILTRPTYSVRQQFCSSSLCNDLSSIAPRFSSEWHAETGALDTTGRNLSASERQLYGRLKAAAGPIQNERLLNVDGQGNEYQFDVSFLLPVKLRGELFVGKLGGRFEVNQSSAEALFAIYTNPD